MKKILMLVAVAGFLASCDNAANTADRTKDSLDSIAKIQKESIENAGDQAKENIDSTNEVKKDLVDSITKGTDTTKSN